jgi:hypothetical protein
VKCPAGRDEKGQTKYRCYMVLGNCDVSRVLLTWLTSISCITGLTPEGSTYDIEHKGKLLPENRKLSVQYGRAKSTMRMSDVSNKPFDAVRSKSIAVYIIALTLDDRWRFTDGGPP